MITGEYRTYQRIKEDAEPIDNIVKYAWNDEDYETVTEWHEYDADELRESAVRELAELKARLAEGVDAIIQFIEDMTQANALTWVATFIEKGRALRKQIAERNSIRQQIAELMEYLNGTDRDDS